MKASVLFGTLVAATGLGAGLSVAATLDEVKARDTLNCGVSTGLAGFAVRDTNENWSGFDVALCRAVAAAVLGDPSKVRYVPTTEQTRFPLLEKAEIDLLARNSAWTFAHDAGAGVDFAGVSYYDGQGFLVRKDLGVSSAKELEGMRICVQSGASTGVILADYFKINNMTYSRVAVDGADSEKPYLANACDVFTAGVSSLAAMRASFADPENHIILPEVISKEPLGPAVRQGDDEWGDIVRWTLNALIAAEEYGITSANLEEMSKGTQNPEINRLLGAEGDLGAMLRLDRGWAKRAIAAGGNYGEIFAATIGETTPIGLARGLNAQWTQGGLLYAPPFR